MGIVKHVTWSILAGTLLSAILSGCDKDIETKASATSSTLSSSESATPALKELYTISEGFKYKEFDQDKGDYVEKDGVLYKTYDIGSTKLIDREVLTFIGNRKVETKSLLEHSLKVIDAILIGTTEVQGYGDYDITDNEAEKLLEEDYEKFRSLYADELKRGLVAAEKMKTYRPGDGNYPWNIEGQLLLKAVVSIERAYSGAIDNLNWSNKEVASEGVAKDDKGNVIDEETEYEMKKQWEADTRLIKARDVLQRYMTWFFGDKIGDIEGVKTDDKPIPSEFASLVPGNHKRYPHNP